MCNTTPNYDQVYVPGQSNNNNIAPNGTANGHTYQNVETDNSTLGAGIDKKSKSPFSRIKTHTNKLISFFKKQPESKDDIPVKHRDREFSGGSYDHLRPTSGSGSVLEYKPKTDSSGHVYSHTDQICSEAENNNSGAKTPSAPPEQSNSNNDVNAVHIGDSYIEFRFGEVDESQKVKSKILHDENTRPEPPKRPPPSPKIDLGKKSPIVNSATNVKAKSALPNNLSPNLNPLADPPRYDYAEGSESPRISPNHLKQQSDNSDTSSTHSYRVLEPQPTYDYADVSDSEVQLQDSYGSLYEDVDDKNQDNVNARKHKSAHEVSFDSGEYLEPIQNRTRTISSPGSLDVKKSHGYVNSPKTSPKVTQELETPSKDKLNAELKLKGANLRKVESSSKDTSPEKAKSTLNTNKTASGIVKSDNVKAKDYEKSTDLKGVLKMKEMFEQKESSDSESSRQSSPRGVETKVKDIRLGVRTKENVKSRFNTDSDA